MGGGGGGKWGQGALSVKIKDCNHINKGVKRNHSNLLPCILQMYSVYLCTVFSSSNQHLKHFSSEDTNSNKCVIQLYV